MPNWKAFTGNDLKTFGKYEFPFRFRSNDRFAYCVGLLIEHKTIEVDLVRGKVVDPYDNRNFTGYFSDSLSYKCGLIHGVFESWRDKDKVVRHVGNCEICALHLQESDSDSFDDFSLLSNFCKIDRDTKIAPFAKLPKFKSQESQNNGFKSQDIFVQSFLSDSTKILLKSKADLFKLPNQRGIYAVSANLDGEEKFVYVGKTNVGIKQRWQQHHKSPDIDLMLRLGIKMQWYCLLFPSESLCKTSDSDLLQLESRLIELLNPVLNGRGSRQISLTI